MAMPTKRTQEVERRIVEGLMSGLSLVKVCEQEGMPDRVTVCKWMSADEAFATKCVRAREIQADLNDDKLIDVVNKLESGELTPEQARVMSSILQWRASKLLPKKYGDRLNVDQQGEVKVLVSYGLPSAPALGEGVIEAEVVELDALEGRN